MIVKLLEIMLCSCSLHKYIVLILLYFVVDLVVAVAQDLVAVA